ncbi:MAG: proton-conducting transporter membrane subunit [Bdellovibrionota bacterium]
MKDFVLFTPEIVLALTLIFILVGEITYFGEKMRLTFITATLGLIAAFAQTLITYQYGASQIFSHSFVIDGLSLFFKLLFIVLALLAILAATRSDEIPKSRNAEYSVLIIGSTLCMGIAASSADLILVFLALQAMNTLNIFIASYGKKSAESAEAGTKYMMFAFISAAFLLYGLAMLFGTFHGLNVYEIQRAIILRPLSNEVTLIVFMFFLFAITFQAGAFPSYFWAPDVTQGAPTPASGFLLVGSRATAFAVAIRIFYVIFAQPKPAHGQWSVLGSVNWPSVLALVAGLTMIVGALLSIRQSSAKRIVGCLAIAETGNLFLGMLVMDEVGIAAVLFNLAIQLFSLMGIYYVLSFLVDEVKSDHLEDLGGMLSRAVPECICLILFLLCLIGFPPLPGFIGKFTLIGAAIRHEWYFLAILAVASGTVATVAVGRMVFSLIGDFKKPTGPVITADFGRSAYLMFLVGPLLFLGVFADFFLNWAGRSMGFIFW